MDRNFGSKSMSRSHTNVNNNTAEVWRIVSNGMFKREEWPNDIR